MKIAIVAEADPAEPRVAATPDTVKKMVALGAEVAVEPDAGLRAGVLDADYTAAGATVAKDAASNADVVLKVRRPAESELGSYRKGALVIAVMDPYGTEAARHARAGHGRALEPGQPRGLSRGDRCLGRIRPRAADDDDRSRDRASRQGVRHGRRRRRLAGDRDRASARRDRDGDRRAARRQGAGREPGREIHRRRG